MRIVRTYRVVSVLEKIGALFGSESISVYVVGGMRRCHGEDLECERFEIRRGEGGLAKEKTRKEKRREAVQEHRRIMYQ